jgi:Fur family peroxide stress response transcriptional regulator
MHKKTRRTPQKLAVIEFLEGNTAHPSVEDIYKALSPRFPTMSLSTVYNVLKSLEREGRVKELTVDPGKLRFDPETGPHSHLVCLGCRKIVDVHRDFKVDLEPRDTQGFELLGREIDFFGYCPECRARLRLSSHK